MPTVRLSSPSTRCVAATVAAATVLLIDGCAVGPDFARPTSPATTPSYADAPLPASTASAPGAGGAAQRFVAADALPAEWWALFRSPELDALVRRALERNPTLDAARQSLRVAEATRRAGQGELGPQVTAGLDAGRNRASRAVSPGATARGLYQGSIGVSYVLDPFGGGRREMEGLLARVDYQRFEVDAASLTLVGNVVAAAIRQASLRDQLQATLDVLALEERQVRIVEAQLAAGGVSTASLLQQKTQAAQTRSTVPALRKAIAQAEDELAVYVGDVPSNAPRTPLGLDALRLPAELPVTLPSLLVRQRPDIRASEALLHAASADVGVATANLYPRIQLSGSIGSQVLSAARLFGTGGFRSLAGSLTEPLFDGGTLRARKSGAEAAYAEADAQYRAVVLGAFRDVADALAAIEWDADLLGRTTEAEQLADRSLQLVVQQHALGATSTLALLESQRAWRQARLGRVQAEAARFTDTAVLFQALGGGWWTRSNAETTVDTPTACR